MYIDGFFQIEAKKDGAYLRLFPPMEGGNKIIAEEILDLCKKELINDIDAMAIKSAVANLSQRTEMKISDTNIIPINETMKIEIDESAMRATARFYPPSSTGTLMTKEEILNDLKVKGIEFGISEEVIEKHLKARQYCHTYLIAEGLPVVPGDDAVIKYNVQLKKKATPKLNEDGSVDFHNLDMISHVKRGEVLAILKKEVLGIDGKNLYGKTISPKLPKVLRLKVGENTAITADECKLYSTCDGHVVFAESGIYVSNVYEVKDDVDVSTGDIEYNGSVYVKGSVRTGFSIKCSGDIIVDGVVEGANLCAGGQIILKRGIQGMNKGQVEAKGNLVARFIESANVKVGGKIQTDTILHSKVHADGDIVLEGKNAYITGGKISTKSNIISRSIGSNMETATELYLGPDYDIMAEMKDVSAKIDLNNEKLEEMDELILNYKKILSKGQALPQDKIDLLKNTMKDKEVVVKEVEEYNQRLDELKSDYDMYSKCKVMAKGIIHPGVRITIINNIMAIKNEESFVRVEKDRAEIVVKPL
ncbi:MAG: DUF342 domain-containing protein [Lachnospiraceae bacterium]|nr:DUF342 domain-containing protein [Lachnospiraceae bacterium]